MTDNHAQLLKNAKASPVAGASSPLTAAVWASTAVLGPLIVVFGMFWAKFQFAARHPGEVAIETPSVSQTIGDPFVGEVFALLMWPAAILLGLAVLRISKMHLAIVDRDAFRSDPKINAMRTFVAMALFLQFLAAIGLLLLSNYPSRVSVPLHMTGSYLLFFGHAVSISLSGYVSRLLQRRAALLPSYCRTGLITARVRLSVIVALSAVVYLVVYLVRNEPLPVPQAAVHAFFVNFEVVLILLFLAYLVSFAYELFLFERDGHSE